MPRAKPKSIVAYIKSFAPDVQAILQKIRATIQEAAPDATEKISYGIPAFFTDEGMLIYFAAFKKHIGLYPPVHGDAKLDAALARYRGPKGNLQLPLDEPIPYPLIKRIVKAQLKVQQARVLAKAAKKRGA